MHYPFAGSNNKPSVDHNDKETETGENTRTKPGLWLIDYIFLEDSLKSQVMIMERVV